MLLAHLHADHHQSDQQERNNPQQIAPLDAASLPPGARQQHHRQGQRHAFGQRRQREHDDRRHEQPPAAAPLVEQVEEHGKQRQRQRQRVLQLRDPGHALDVDRVQREQGRRQQGARHPQQRENAPDQNRRNGVQRDVDEMESDRVQSPKLVLHPVGRGRDRPVVDVRAGHPGAKHAAGLEHRIVQQVEIVVPDKSALPGRLICQDTATTRAAAKSQSVGRRVFSRAGYRSDDPGAGRSKSPTK